MSKTKLAIIIFVIWLLALTWALIDEGVIQIGGTNFKLESRNEIITISTKPLIIKLCNDFRCVQQDGL